MKVCIVRTNGDFFYFGNASEVSKTEDYLRLKSEDAVRYFELATILRLSIDGRDIPV